MIDKLVEECIENIDEKELHSNSMNRNGTLNEYKNVCNSSIIYIVLFIIFFIISISISNVSIYFHWYLKIVIVVLLMLILVLKQQFIKWNSTGHINGKYQTN